MDIVKIMLLIFSTLAQVSICTNQTKQPLPEKRLIGGQTITRNISMFVKLVAKDQSKETNCVGTVIHPEYVLTHTICVTGAEVVHVFISNVKGGNESLTASRLSFRQDKGKLNFRGLNNQQARTSRRQRVPGNFGSRSYPRNEDRIYKHQVNSGLTIYEFELGPDDVFVSYKRLATLEISNHEISTCSHTPHPPPPTPSPIHYASHQIWIGLGSNAQQTHVAI